MCPFSVFCVQGPGYSLSPNTKFSLRPTLGAWEDLKPGKCISSVISESNVLDDHNLVRIQSNWKDELGMELGDYLDCALTRFNCPNPVHACLFFSSKSNTEYIIAKPNWLKYT